MNACMHMRMQHAMLASDRRIYGYYIVTMLLSMLDLSSRPNTVCRRISNLIHFTVLTYRGGSEEP